MKLLKVNDLIEIDTHIYKIKEIQNYNHINYSILGNLYYIELVSRGNNESVIISIFYEKSTYFEKAKFITNFEEDLKNLLEE
jgi:hypothetical protein